MDDHIGSRRLGERLIDSAAPGAAEVSRFVGSLPPDDRFDLDRVAAATLARMLRRSRQVPTASLEALVAVLDGLGASDVLFGRHDSESETAVVVLDVASGAVVAGSVRPIPEREVITAGELAGILRRADDASIATTAVARTLELLSTRDDDEALVVGRQGASATARTFRTKYSMARETGVTVLGLEEFADRLSALGDTEIALCLASTDDAHVVAALDADRSAAITALVVTDLATT